MAARGYAVSVGLWGSVRDGGQTARRLLAGAWTGVVLAVIALAGCGGSHQSKPQNPDSKASYQALLGAGVDLLRQGNTEAARQLFAQAVAKRSNDPVAHYDLGLVYQQTGDLRRAIGQYNRALLLDSHYVPALFNEAVIFSSRDVPLAIFYFRKVTEMQPKAPTAYLDLGLLESRGGSKSLHRRAVQDLRRALAQDPSLRGRIPANLRAEVTGNAASSQSTAS
jgi:Tfp pilus assembly protein PilF